MRQDFKLLTSWFCVAMSVLGCGGSAAPNATPGIAGGSFGAGGSANAAGSVSHADDILTPSQGGSDTADAAGGMWNSAGASTTLVATAGTGGTADGVNTSTTLVGTGGTAGGGQPLTTVTTTLAAAGTGTTLGSSIGGSFGTGSSTLARGGTGTTLGSSIGGSLGTGSSTLATAGTGTTLGSSIGGSSGTGPRPVVLANRTYVVRIPDSRWKSPKGSLGVEMGRYVPTFLLEVGGDVERGFTVMIGSGDPDGTQDLCSPTSEVAASAPDMQIGPTNIKLHLTNESRDSKIAPLYGVTYRKILPSLANSETPEGEFRATLDVRDIWHLLNALDPSSPDVVCETLANSFESSCIACPSDSAVYCVELRAIALAAQPMTGSTMRRISETDIAASCTTGSGKL